MWKQVDDEWLRLYDEEKPSLYPDARDCVARLKAAGLRLALVSNGSEARIERELSDFGLAPAFESVLCGRRQEELKPAPVMLRRTLAALGPRDAVYVGDAPADAQAAKRVGMVFIAIARGRILRDRLLAEGPDRLFDGLASMTEFVLKPK